MASLIDHRDVTKVVKNCRRIIDHFYNICGLGSQLYLLKRYDLAVENGQIVDSITQRVNYHNYPYLFRDLFPPISRGELIELAIATQLFAEYAISLDKIIDQQKTGNEIITLLLLSSQYRHAEAMERFHELMKGNPAFWRHLDKYRAQHFQALIKEKRDHLGSIKSFSLKEMEIISQGKQALAKIVPVAMALLTDHEKKINPITKSQDFYATGLQLYDDLKDWRVDYRKKNYTYILTRVLLENNLVRPDNCDKLPDENTVGKYIYFSDLFKEILAMADEYFKKAVDCLGRLSCPLWRGYIEKAREICQGLKEDLESIREHILRGVVSALPEEGLDTGLNASAELNSESLNESISKGLDFLLRQQKNDFPEARHLEILGRLGRGDHRSACQWGTTFQRTIILDTLIDMREKNVEVPKAIIDEEVEKIVRAKLQTRKGGWSYFPQITSLPPDADDLGQVIQVLVKSGYGSVREICKEPIEILIKYNTHPDGSVDTWIAYPKEAGSLEAKLEMQQVWGITPDTEVVANVLYGLSLYDRKRFESLIRKGIKFIENRQLSEGYWDCNWYFGKYYGTWVCSRLISIFNNESVSFKKGLDFVIKNQNEDGGWGENGKSNPLDTSFGMLTISLSSEEGKMRDQIFRALQFLQQRQQLEGWEGSDFIKVDPGRYYGALERDSQPEIKIYKSRTITTAFCLKAMLKGQELLHW